MQFHKYPGFQWAWKREVVFSMTAAQVFDKAEQRALINCSLAAKYT